MHEVKTTSENQIRYDPQRHVYHIKCYVPDMNPLAEDLEFVVPTASILVVKKDKNGKVLSQGVTIADLEAIINDMVERPHRKKNKTGEMLPPRVQRIETESTDEPNPELSQEEFHALEQKIVNTEASHKQFIIEDDEDVPNDIPLKPVEKPKKNLLEKAKDKIQPPTKQVIKEFRKTLTQQAREGFTHQKLTDTSIAWFKKCGLVKQKIVLMEFPQFRHKLEKHTRIDVRKLPVKARGVSKREKDEQIMQQRGMTG